MSTIEPSSEDLLIRLRRFRSRLASAGRNEALAELDRAIAEVSAERAVPNQHRPGSGSPPGA